MLDASHALSMTNCGLTVILNEVKNLAFAFDF